MDKIKKLRLITAIGVVLFLPNLILNVIDVLEISEFNNILFLITGSLFAVGGVVVFVSGIMLNEERRKEKIKSNIIKKR